MAARTLCVGFDGTEASSELLKTLARMRPAGIVLFARNIVSVDTCRELVECVRAVCEEDLPLLVAVDQEGGRVARLRRGAVEVPSAMALGAADDERLCERVGLAIARDVRRAGANLNLAPVLDVVSNARNRVIGTRSFGDDPERVARLGLALARGLERGGVIAAAKHFPGHGATADDSHLTLPTIDGDAARLRARDLAPFAQAVERGIRAIMTAHVAVPAFEPDVRRPATTSCRVLTDLLRGELGFTGVCITDCLEMQAIAGTVGSERGAVEALRAGADLLLVSHSPTLALRIAHAVAGAVRDGTLSEARLHEAVARVDRLRASLRAMAPFPSEDLGAGREAARRSLVLERGALPHWPAGTRAVVVSLGPASLDGGAVEARDHGPTLAEALERHDLRAEEIRIEAFPADRALRRACDLVERGGPRTRVAVIVRRGLHQTLQIDAARTLLTTYPDALLVVAREPYDAVLVPEARHVVCTFGDEPISFDALAGMLADGAQPEGRMPVSLAAVG